MLRKGGNVNMTFEQYEARKKAIGGWYNEYIKEKFTKIEKFGHLSTYHLNKSDKFLKKRSVKRNGNSSSFLGDESTIIEMLQSLLIENREEVIEYLADETDEDVWEMIGVLSENVKGKIFLYSKTHDWNKGPVVCEYYIISLKKEVQGNGFIITSAYPIQL